MLQSNQMNYSIQWRFVLLNQTLLHSKYRNILWLSLKQQILETLNSVQITVLSVLVMDSPTTIKQQHINNNNKQQNNNSINKNWSLHSVFTKTIETSLIIMNTIQSVIGHICTLPVNVFFTYNNQYLYLWLKQVSLKCFVDCIIT